ncbi:MAG: type II toxin-antitoxin system VapC family toxin [Planctomycetota bacterium]|jgi:predicted nucleic acid-binding protein
MRQREAVFVDSGAWIALALVRDPLHVQSRELWQKLLDHGARLFTSVPVVLETFTFFDRNASRDVALSWKDSLSSVRGLKTLACNLDDLRRSWDYFSRGGLHKLSAVDATSFAIMKRAKIGCAFAFDHHFAVVGFRMAG